MNTFLKKHQWLLLAAVIGLGIYLFVMPQVHSPAYITQIADKDLVTEKSRHFIDHSGYRSNELQPFATFHTDDDLIRRQVAHFGRSRLNDFIKNGFLQFIPSYHWQVLWINTEISDENMEMQFSTGSYGNYKQPAGEVIFRTQHAPNGTIQEYKIESELGSDYVVDGNFRMDSLDTAKIQPGKKISETQGHQTIRNAVHGTVWHNHLMRVDTVYHSQHFEQQVTAITLNPESAIFGHYSEINLTLNPDGSLIGIEQTVSIPHSEEPQQGETFGGMRFIIFVLGGLLLLTIFFRRLFYRLIDLRSSTIYGIIAGVICLLQMGHLLIQTSILDQIGIQILPLFTLAIALVFLSSIVGILVFMLSALGESLTREIWPDKVNTSSMIRLGYIRCKSIGHSAFAGVMAALVYLGIATLIYALSNHSYFNPLDGQFFYAESFLFSYWHIFVVSLFWMFLISAGLFSSLLSWIAIKKKKTILLLLAGGVLFSLMSSFHIETSSPVNVLLFGFFPGVAAVWFFLKYDLVTIFISIFLFIASWSTLEGWIIADSADSWLSYSIFLLMGLIAISGIYLTFYGEEYEHLPELTPDYIREITREQRVERELEIAHQVHQSFLPVDLPQLDDLDISASCQAAFDVGGDYYDVIRLDEHRIAFVIGDVSGKGIQAAFYMTMIKGIFQSLVKEIPDPLPLLGRMNRLFYANARRGSFISICYGVIDTRDNTLRYARAGHNPAIFKATHDRHAKMLQPGGLALGLTDTLKFDDHLKEQKLHIKPGDLLIFYTDGITEAVDPQGNMFGDQRLLEEVNSAASLSPDRLIARLFQSISTFTSGTSASDDMTILAVKRK